MGENSRGSQVNNATKNQNHLREKCNRHDDGGMLKTAVEVCGRTEGQPRHRDVVVE